jgi:3-hydroxyisobutyrate dehydrogenase
MSDHGRVAFLGLGTMGFPMAASLLRSGFSLTVVPHRSREAAETLEGEGARLATTAAEAARDADFVVTMLPTDVEVREVLLGAEGAAQAASPGTLFIDMSTIAPEAARSISADLVNRNLRFLDAPVSGGPARAASGELTIMAGGSRHDVRRADAVLHSMGERVFHVGEVGAGQAAKACNNLLVAACMLANVEALALGAAAGIDPGTLHEIIVASSGTNWQLENIVPKTVLRNDYTPLFALPLLNKDLGIAAGMAEGSGAAFHVGQLARDLYAQATEEGVPRDFSSVVHLYEKVLSGGPLESVARRRRAVTPNESGAQQ